MGQGDCHLKCFAPSTTQPAEGNSNGSSMRRALRELTVYSFHLGCQWVGVNYQDKDGDCLRSPVGGWVGGLAAEAGRVDGWLVGRQSPALLPPTAASRLPARRLRPSALIQYPRGSLMDGADMSGSMLTSGDMSAWWVLCQHGLASILERTCSRSSSRERHVFRWPVSSPAQLSPAASVR